MDKDSDLVVFMDDAQEGILPAEAWRILIVDDDSDVHVATQYGIEHKRILGRRLEFLHAYSAAQARHLLQTQTDIAVILLDVVMESDDAGLRLARHIREDLALLDVRIILRTGQPGYAPEAEVIQSFDINDYKTKSELTHRKLHTALTAAIRSYHQLSSATRSRQLLERENRSIESRLREDETRLRLIAEGASDAIVVTSQHGRIELWNQGAERMFGVPPVEAIGKRLSLAIPDDYQDARGRSFASRARRSAHGQDIELTLSRSPIEGDAVPVELTVASWDSGNGLHYSSIFRDITERCRFEQELIAARDAATTLARAKADFVANVSHEIRTPMHGILGMADLALATDLTAEQREYIELARTSAESLLSLINNILDFSKIEAHKLLLERVPFNLRKIIEDALKPQHARARQRNLGLNLEIAPEIPQVLQGDPLRLRQIVLNLVGNALKFTQRGSIDVRVDLVERQAHRLALQFAVSDTGVGIPADKLGLVFEAFAQADTSISREYGGTGLGLSICAQLVGLMQGRIWVQSQPAQGSTFFFTAWFEHATQALAHDLNLARTAPESGGDPSLGRPLKVLLAEDNPVNQRFALTVLGKAGYTTRLAHNGQEALDLALREAFDVILMDVQMPVMDGFAATRALRQSGIGVPIVAMTAHAMDGFRELSLEAGMNDYVSKPILAGALLEKLAAILPEIPQGDARFQAAKVNPIDRAIDMNEALLAVAGDSELLVQLAGLVLAQIDQDLPVLCALASAGDSASLREAAHRLKGSLGGIAATPAFEACKVLETLARSEAVSQYAAAVQALLEQIRQLRPELDTIVRRSGNATLLAGRT